ncbi:hypothetical protein V8E52_007666, partial [Russula decolorans]
TWRSPIYSFFKSDNYHNSRLCHFFPCTARKCKTPVRGVRRYQDSKDRASTANLRHHALRCFGEEVVCNSTKGARNNGTSGSIFASFAHPGQKPVHYSNQTHTNAEVCAHLVKWITENNQPVNIVNDRELCELLTVGRPQIRLPGHATVSRDIKACFGICRDRVATLLQEYPGRLHFTTNAWTSPNHRAFVA